MRRIIAQLALSLDGKIEGSNRSIDWIVMDEKVNIHTFLNTIDTVIYGRTCYDLFIKDAETEGEGPEIAFNRAIKSKEAIVLSRSGYSADGVTVLSGTDQEIAAQLKQLKTQQGKDIWFFGGEAPMAMLTDHDVIDEYQLAIMPAIVGNTGLDFFDHVSKAFSLKLYRSEVYASGIVLLHYEVLRP